MNAHGGSDRQPDGVIELFAQIFQSDPGVGFAVCNENGVVLYANQRSAELFIKGPPEQAMGRTLEELFGEEWAAERLAMFQQTQDTGRPIISRHIRHGVQLQSTIRVLNEPEDGDPVFSIITTLGEHDPRDGEDYDIVESKLMHLGPLDPLTRREIEVLALIGHGMSTPQIAGALHRSPRTIEQHCESIRGKLKGASRVQLADFARRACLQLDDASLKRI